MSTVAETAPRISPIAPETRARPVPPGVARRRRWRWLVPLLLLSSLTMFASHILVFRDNVLSPLEAWRALVGSRDAPSLDVLALEFRIPRAILGWVAGAALAASGALLQALARNPLASPDFTGVTAGAVAAVVAWVTFAPPIAPNLDEWVHPMVATAGGSVAAVVVYLLTRRGGSLGSTRLLLMGILVGGVLTSFTTLCLILLGRNVQGVLAWMSGSLSAKTYADVARSMVYVGPGILLLVLAIPRANVLQLGDDVAIALGQRRELDRGIVLMAAVVLTAGVVAVAGALGFVGLIGPHIVRRSVGSDLRRLVPAAALAGGVMVLVADFLSRNLDPSWLPGEFGNQFEVQIPAGVYLTLFGIPFLLSLLWKRSR